MSITDRSIRWLLKAIVLVGLLYLANNWMPNPIKISEGIILFCVLVVYNIIFKKAGTRVRIFLLLLPALILACGFIGSFGVAGHVHFLALVLLYHVRVEFVFLVTGILFGPSLKWLFPTVILFFIVAVVGSALTGYILDGELQNITHYLFYK